MNTNATTTTAGAPASSPKKCAFCDLPSTGQTDPPACPRHEDLMVLTEWMRAHDMEVTPDSVAARVALARTHSPAGWTITPEEVAAWLPAVVAARNEQPHAGRA